MSINLISLKMPDNYPSQDKRCAIYVNKSEMSLYWINISWILNPIWCFYTYSWWKKIGTKERYLNRPFPDVLFYEWSTNTFKYVSLLEIIIGLSSRTDMGPINEPEPRTCSLTGSSVCIYTLETIPTGAQRNNNVIMMSKRQRGAVSAS